MSLSKIFRLEFNSKLLRSLLGIVYREGKFYPILFGKLRGLKSYYQPDVNFHAILGLWEKDSLQVLEVLFRKFDLDKKQITVADVGANLGYYALFFSKYLHPGAQIVAFEPSPAILGVLKKNLAANKTANVELAELACSDKPGTVEFFIGEHHHQSSMLEDWAENKKVGKKLVVKSTSLDEFFDEKTGRKLPDLIKMDIEGGGVFALKGAQKCISQKRPFILIESHTAEEDMAISSVLLSHNYEAFRLNDKAWVTRKDKDYRDPGGVSGTMLLVPNETRASLESSLVFN